MKVCLTGPRGGSRLPPNMLGHRKEGANGGSLPGKAGGEPHSLLWLGLPIASVAMVWLTPLWGARRWRALMMGERGYIEVATVVFLVPAIVLSVLIFIRRRELPKGVGCLMLLGGLAALYFAGEEISWGQWVIGFETPEAFAKKNAQGEFNLHNLHGGSLLNNVPRQLMLWFTVIGGMILPLALGKRLSNPRPRNGPWYWLIPTRRMIPAAAMAAFSTVPEKIFDLIGRPEGYLRMAFIDPAGEFKEYCFALVILLYLLSIYLRMGRQTRLTNPARRAATD